MYTAIYVYNMYYTIPVQESIMSPNHWQSATTKFCASCLYSYSMSSAVQKYRNISGIGHGYVLRFLPSSFSSTWTILKPICDSSANCPRDLKRQCHVILYNFFRDRTHTLAPDLQCKRLLRLVLFSMGFRVIVVFTNKRSQAEDIYSLFSTKYL